MRNPQDCDPDIQRPPRHSGALGHRAGLVDDMGSAREDITEERHAEIVRLRRCTLSYSEIARRVGLSKSAVAKVISEHMAELAAEERSDLQELRREALERLLPAIELAQKAIDDGDLSAIDRLVKLEERRAKLLGTDAPTKASVVVRSNPLEGLTPEQIAYVAEHGELPEGVEVPGLQRRG